jgi:hypothetical protein
MQAEISNTLLNSQIRVNVDNPGTDVPLYPLNNLVLYPVCLRSRKLSGETAWTLSLTNRAALPPFLRDAQEVYWGFGEARPDPCHFCP